MSWVLITGASSGIGQQLSYLFASNGFDVFLTARNEDRLEEMKNEIQEKYKVNCKYYICDLAIDNEAEKIYDYVINKGIIIDQLVNCAGMAIVSNYDKLTDEQIKSINNVNMNSTVQLTQLFVKDMMERRNGKILNVSSINSFVAAAGLNLYSSTKAYIRYYSEILAQEVKPYNISVSCLCPGPVKTFFLVEQEEMTAHQLYRLNM